MSPTFDRSRVRALLFDVDGTLADTDDALVQRLASSLARCTPEPKAIARARRWVLVGETLFNAAYSTADRLGLDNLASPLIDLLHTLRGEGHPGRFTAVPGVPEALHRLHPHYRMAVVSARDERGVRAFLEAFSLTPLFQCVVTARTCWRTKPHAAPVLWAARQLGVPPHGCLMVGDTAVDIRAGRAAGTQTAGVLCGFGRRVELERAGADLILETTPALAGILLGPANA